MLWIIVAANLILAFLLFALVEKLALSFRSWKILFPVFLFSIVFALPGFFCLPQYTRMFDNAKWFYDYRTFAVTDFLIGGIGFIFGLLAALLCRNKMLPHAASVAVLSIVVIVPFVKPLLSPVDGKLLEDKWTRDGFCMQTSDSTCGPASAVNLMKVFGIDSTEKELAAECFTSKSGTEIWYIARAFKRRGLKSKFIITESEKIDVSNIPCPSIAGTFMGGIGHFISILDKTDNGYITVDPLVGKREISKDKIMEQCGLNGFFLKVSK